jgi:hypothetical protein
MNGCLRRYSALVAVVATLSLGACASNGLKPVQDSTRAQVIDHLVPARDSMGRLPAQFSWTAVQGADEYSVGIWNEVDMLMWRLDHIPGTSTPRPEDLKLEPGTYLWSISALRGGQQIAESGLAAFVVRDDTVR